MGAEEIQKILHDELRIYKVKIQVNETKEQLTIVLNRPADAKVDYSALTENIVTKLNTCKLEVSKYKILGRVEKTTKPEWQQLFDNPHGRKASRFLGFFNSKFRKSN